MNTQHHRTKLIGRYLVPGRKFVTTLVLLALLTYPGVPARAVSPVKLKNWEGEIDLSTGGITPFTLHGTASHLGQFEAYGEVDFVSGEEAGTLEGDGVVVFEAANGDLLVGVVSWDAGEEANAMRPSAIHFSWRDSVEFSDGTVVSSTGRFVKSKPPGLVVIAIIAILIGMLLPAVQKVREAA